MSITGKNPFHYPSFSLRNRLARLFWIVVYSLLFRTSFRTMHVWRSFLLRCFGSKVGKNCHFYPKCKIWAPWNLKCGNYVVVGDEAEIYNPKRVILDDYVTVSQKAYLCGASHEMENPDFPLIAEEITIGKRAWICARATVLMGVSVGEGAVLALGSVSTKDLEPWTVYGGIPARKIRKRSSH